MDATIKASFWTDNRVEELDKDGKLACLWLFTNPARDLCGFTKVSNKRFTFETGLSASDLEGVCKGLPSSIKEVSKGVFFAVNFIRQQFGNGGKLSLGNKVIVAAARYADKLPEKMRDAFFLEYPELLPLVVKGNENDGGSIPHTVKRDGVRVRAREGEGEEGVQGEVPEALFNGGQVDVPGIVGLYPRREKVQEACESVARSIRKGASPETIAAGTRAFAAAILQLPGGALNCYVPGAGAFFREERWKDDPQTILRQGGNARNGAPRVERKPDGRKGTVIKISAGKR